MLQHHKDIEVLGIIAVASRTRKEEWTRVDVSIDRYGNITAKGVDKYGIQEMEKEDCMEIPFIVLMN